MGFPSDPLTYDNTKPWGRLGWDEMGRADVTMVILINVHIYIKAVLLITVSTCYYGVVPGIVLLTCLLMVIQHSSNTRYFLI